MKLFVCKPTSETKKEDQFPFTFYIAASEEWVRKEFQTDWVKKVPPHEVEEITTIPQLLQYLPEQFICSPDTSC